VKPLDLAAIGKLTFAKPDRETFPLLDLAGVCLEKGGVAGAVLNGANEGAVALFLEGKITFTQISELVLKVVEEFEEIKDPTLEEICLAGEEAEARLRALA
jgi:1-deoxy-D-xylulose-5-phosphate reductoisomerase